MGHYVSDKVQRLESAVYCTLPDDRFRIIFDRKSPSNRTAPCFVQNAVEHQQLCALDGEVSAAAFNEFKLRDHFGRC